MLYEPDPHEQLELAARLISAIQPGQRLVLALSETEEIGFLRLDRSDGEILQQAYFDSREDLDNARRLLGAAVDRGEIEVRAPTVWTWPGDDTSSILAADEQVH